MEWGTHPNFVLDVLFQYLLGCLEHFSLNCIIKILNLKVNDPPIEQVNSLGTSKEIVQSLHRFWTNNSVSQ